MLVGGLAPILAPLVGGALLHVTDWRGIFVVLAGIGAVLLLAAWAMLAETLAPRRSATPAASWQRVRVFGGLVRDRAFMGYTLSAGLAFGAMAAYISGSPFVLQDIHGISPQLFSVLFALNAVRDHGSPARSAARSSAATARARCSTAGVSIGAVGGLGVLVSVVADLGLAGLLPSLFVMVSSVGMVLPNAAALALADHPRTAGSASALLGLSAVRHRRAGRPARRRRRLAHGAADGDRHGHAAARRPRLPAGPRPAAVAHLSPLDAKEAVQRQA